MRPLFISLWLSLIPWMLSAQAKWGYSVASLKVQANEEFFEIVFISNVKRLSSLHCREDSATTALAVDDRYEKCICDWFYQRIGQVYPKAYEFLDRHQIMGDIEWYINPPQGLRERLHELAVPLPEYPTIYHVKSDALKRRNQFLALAKQSNSFIVEID